MDIHIAMEESYKNGYLKGQEDWKPKWISVTERLPDKRLRVLALTELKGMIVARHTEVGWVVSWNNAQCPKITHWMPLPELP